jgi:hypothetical protein
VATKYILGALAIAFLVAAAARLLRNGNRIDPAARTWLTIGIIFAVVSGWLWLARA